MEARTIDYGGIGWAVSHMRHGHRLRRLSWTNKSLWVGYITEDVLYVSDEGKASILMNRDRALPLRPMLVMHQSDGTVGPYSANQADLLAGDWELVDAPQPGHTSAP